MSEKKYIYVGFAFSHHKGTHAGYDKISNYLSYDKKIDCQKYIDNCDSKKILRKIIHKVCNVLFCIPDIPLFLLKIFQIGCFSDNSVFHFIYGENTFFLLAKFFSRKGNKFVCTFHQPFEWFEHNPRYMNYLKSLDAIILVGKAEINKFEAVTGKKNVFFIPHGICTDFYKPVEYIHKEHMLLTVGNWLRDYDFADRVYQRLLAEDPELIICVVANKEKHSRITKHPRIRLCSGISDEQLRDLYCQCSVLFLPLVRYTANNALLEAGATGCNIVVSSDFPDNSYIPNSFISLTQMNVDDAVKTVKESIKCSYNYELSAYVCSHFSWEKIARKTEDVLRAL